MNQLITGVILLAIIVLIVRWLGAWMLRINDLIISVKEVNQTLKNIKALLHDIHQREDKTNS